MLRAPTCQQLCRVSAGLWVRGEAEADRLRSLPAPSRLGVNGPGLGWSPRASAEHSQHPSVGAELTRPAQPPASEQGPRPPWAWPQRAAGGGVPVARQAGECRAALGWLPDALLPPGANPRCLGTQKSLGIQARRAQARPFHRFAVHGAPGTLKQIEGCSSLWIQGGRPLKHTARRLHKLRAGTGSGGCSGGVARHPTDPAVEAFLPNPGCSWQSPPHPEGPQALQTL